VAEAAAPAHDPAMSSVTEDREVLAASHLSGLASHGLARDYAARTVIVSEGEESDALYVILEGRARAYVSDENGRELELSVMGPGEYFGEIALDSGPRSANVVTLGKCRMLVVPREELAAFIAGHPEFAQQFIHRLIQRVRTLTASVRSLALLDAYGRVARLVMDGAITVGDERFLPGRPTQVELANRVGCSREMVSRIFKDLVAGGFVTLEPARIVLHKDLPPRW
jgi:CRP/FNR family transcriptional regulator, cyclic AMP receptor protein